MADEQSPDPATDTQSANDAFLANNRGFGGADWLGNALARVGSIPTASSSDELPTIQPQPLIPRSLSEGIGNRAQNLWNEAKNAHITPQTIEGARAFLDPVAMIPGANVGLIDDQLRAMYHSRLGTKELPQDYDFYKKYNEENAARERFMRENPETTQTIGSVMEAGLSHPYGLGHASPQGERETAAPQKSESPVKQQPQDLGAALAKIGEIPTRERFPDPTALSSDNYVVFDPKSGKDAAYYATEDAAKAHAQIYGLDYDRIKNLKLSEEAEPEAQVPQPDYHPAKGPGNMPIWIDRPTTPTNYFEVTNPQETAIFVPGKHVPGSLNNVPFEPWWDAPETDKAWNRVEGQNPELDAIPFDPQGKTAGAGVVIMEPDGRIWLTAPTNEYGGYKATFPKGTAEYGANMQATAIREAFEETGLKVRLVGLLGDFDKTTSRARIYLAERVGGTPAEMGWESQGVHLATKEEAAKLLNQPVDKPILDAAFKQQKPNPPELQKSWWVDQDTWDKAPKTAQEWKQLIGHYDSNVGLLQHLEDEGSNHYSPEQIAELKAGAIGQLAEKYQSKLSSPADYPRPYWASKTMWDKAPKTASDWGNLVGDMDPLVQQLTQLETGYNLKGWGSQQIQNAKAKILGDLVAKYQGKFQPKSDGLTAIDDNYRKLLAELESQYHANHNPKDDLGPWVNDPSESQWKVVTLEGLEVGHYATEAEAKAHARQDPYLDYFHASDKQDYGPATEPIPGWQPAEPAPEWTPGQRWRPEAATPSQRQAIQGYSDGLFGPINECLRFLNDDPLNPHEQEAMRDLDNVTQNASFDQPVKRTLPYDALALFDRKDWLRPGAEFDDPGFGSFSSKLSYTHHESGFSIYVENPGDGFAYVDPHSEYSGHEFEVLAARNTRFRVLDWDPVTKKMTAEVLHPEQIPSLEGSSKLTQLPASKMRDYNGAEFPWEYREFTQYASHLFPGAFKDASDFRAKYEVAPTVHLNEAQLRELEYATVAEYMSGGNAVSRAHADFGGRRDTKRIENDLLNGRSAPPIVLMHDNGLRILGGNTRLSMAAAHGYSMPVKVIDISGSE